MFGHYLCDFLFPLKNLKQFDSHTVAGLPVHPIEFKSVSQMHMTNTDSTHFMVNVTFATLFHNFSSVLVVASAKFEQVSQRHSGAAVWVKDVSRSGFTGVIQLPEGFIDDGNTHVHLEYIAYQINVHRRTKLFEGGSVDIPEWDTGSICTRIKPKVCEFFGRFSILLGNSKFLSNFPIIIFVRTETV